MADPVTLTIDGRQIQATPGTYVIEAAKQAGIEIPAFCYYEGLSLQAACRMCLVEVEKAPKLLAGCTLTVAEGMVVKTDTPAVQQARKSTLEFLLTNHPLDCPVCDKGGECELQDMVFRYGAGESRFTENKIHVEEKQWSPVVFFDASRCILCYRCVRICDEGLGVGALGVNNRGVVAEITPSHGDHLECDECGNCIDICPVGALTSGIYRYKTRPWEMRHVGTICTHCSNGCKTTLGVRNDAIVRGNNRDRSGINNEFLCIKGRYAFDFVQGEERLQSPLMKVDGKLEPVSWSKALRAAATALQSAKQAGQGIGVIGSPRLTNEEAYYLQKFARQGLETPHVDHQRSGDLVTLFDALSGSTHTLASLDDFYTSKAVLVVGTDLSQQHPLLAFQVRANYRHHAAHVYVIAEGDVREEKIATRFVQAAQIDQLAAVEGLREALAAEPELLIAFGDTIKGDSLRKLVAFAASLGIPVKFCCLLDYANSRGAVDMGLAAELLPGYHPASPRGMSAAELATAPLGLLWAVNADPLAGQTNPAGRFLIVQDLFLTETARQADIVFPAASSYEKSGTFTNVTGQVQQLKHALNVMGTKTDLEIFGLLARELKLNLGLAKPDAVFAEIAAGVNGYRIPLPVVATGGAALTMPVNGRIAVDVDASQILSARDTLFTSGELTRYSPILSRVIESPGALYDRETSRLIDQPVAAT